MTRFLPHVPRSGLPLSAKLMSHHAITSVVALYAIFMAAVTASGGTPPDGVLLTVVIGTVCLLAGHRIGWLRGLSR